MNKPPFHKPFFPTLLSLLLMLPVFATSSPSAGLTDKEIEKIQHEALNRRQDFFRRQAGTPLKRSPIDKDWNNRGDFTRNYNQSIVMFAMKSLYLNERVEEANAALREMCQYHLDRPQTFLDIHSFPWICNPLVRLAKFFGPRGSKSAGRMDDVTYQIVLKTMWEWVRQKSTLQQTDVAMNKTWWLQDSENHHFHIIATCWAFSMMLKDEPAYRDRLFNDGHTAAEHYKSWIPYLCEYLRQRACKGMLIEIDSPSYDALIPNEVYSLYDFSDDSLLKRRASQFLDLYWALWAEHQIDSVPGGGKTRCTADHALRGGGATSAIAWYAFGAGKEQAIQASLLPFITTTWKMPDIVIDLALDVEGRGSYEIRQRRMGLAEPGYSEPPNYRLRTDFGGILRYGWCTPDFIMGSLLTEARPREDWTAISAQNRWSGVIFRGARDARVFASTSNTKKPSKTLPNDRNESIYNGQWVVQAHGTQISQKLKDSKDADQWGVYFSNEGLSKPEREGRWIFAEGERAYVAVCVTQGDFAFHEKSRPSLGRWIQCADDFAPVIIEVISKTPGSSFAAFRRQVLAQSIETKDGILSYTGLGGDRFKFHTDQSQPPQINGQVVDYAPARVFDSPFIQSDWNSGVITVQKDSRKYVLNFN